MRIAIGSTRESKVEAAKEAWGIFSAKVELAPSGETHFVSFDVPTSSPNMPLTAKEVMQGAQDRADRLMLQLKKEKAEADFYIGLESGFNVVDARGARRQVFLESWAYVSDGYRGYFGHGGGIYVPPAISSQVMDRGIELGIVIDRFSQQNDVRSAQGTWGVLTRDILNRQHSFVVALIAAFAPFYNAAAYSS